MSEYTDVPPHIEDPDEWLAQQELRAKQRAMFHRGGIILDTPSAPDPVWGFGTEVLASRGEPMIVTGGIGAGKTTILGNLVHARLGLSHQVLGWPVREGGRMLYVAADRPRQILRNLGRRFTEADRQVLDDRLVVWKGPPPRDLAAQPDVLREMCAVHDLGDNDTVVLDSIKDVARDLSKDETGSGLNRAFQLVVRDGIELWASHHQRKASNGQAATKPKTLADVYGSTWITAGAGTVLLLWADRAGAAFIELTTIKPAADDIGPLTVHHDLDSGRMALADAVTVESYLQAEAHMISRTLGEILNAIGADPGDRNRADQVRRQLRKLDAAGMVRSTPMAASGGGKPPLSYRWEGPRG